MEPSLKIDGVSFDLGEHTPLLLSAVEKAQNENVATRIWERDFTLWKPQPDEISTRLGWLDISQRNLAEVDALVAFAQAVKEDGIKGALLLGMGGSSLAPELFSTMFTRTGSGLALDVLDSTDPAAVQEKIKVHNPAETLFIVSSKSGGTEETFSFFKTFYNLAVKQLGPKQAGNHFVAITDPGSKLAKQGEQLGFRQVFLADSTIGGRYSALSKFGLVPAALLGIDIAVLLASAEGMAKRCRTATIDKNPGLLLGLALGSLAKAGCDKATFRLPESKSSFADWAEQLIAESTGKENGGILPVAHEPQLADQAYGDDRVFIGLGATTNNQPSISVEWDNDTDLGGQFFLWEFATAVAGYFLGINPFDQPNVEAAKVQARRLVEEYQKSAVLPKGKTRAVSTQALQSFLGSSRPGDYIALQAYLAPSVEVTKAMRNLRERLGAHYHLATTQGYGPRFLHSTGQLHKGDGGNGLFIQFVTPPPENDLPIPTDPGSQSSDITYGILKTAQAVGDAQALRDGGRRVLSFEIPEHEAAKQINELLP